MSEAVTFSFFLRGVPYELNQPEVMGILNVTPDSFFEGSRKQTEKEIAERVHQIIDEGGTMIDVGAYSTRPGAQEVSTEEEMRRMRFALETIRRESPKGILSIDTFRPEVARMAVEEFSADIINDVSEGSKEMFSTIAQLCVPYILMSVKPTLKEMISSFRSKIQELDKLGFNNIILDPGYGFGKDIIQNYAILREQQQLLSFGMPLLVGVSRKRMIWQLLETSPSEALNGTSVVNTLALLNGAHILRVHDVREAVETIKITKACSST